MKVLGVDLPVEDAFAPLVKLGAKIGMGLTLKALREKDPNMANVVAATIYGPVDVYAETYAEGTPTKLDNAAVEGVMEAIEDYAQESGIGLPVLDED